MDPEYISSIIQTAEDSLRNAKSSLEISRDFLRDQETADTIRKLQNALYEIGMATDVVTTALGKLELYEQECSK